MQNKINTKANYHVNTQKQTPKRVKELNNRNTYLAPYWYVIALSKSVSTQKPYKVTCFDKDIVLYREYYGQIVAQNNVCPHRGAPLDQGWIEHNSMTNKTNIVCPYHGWNFDTNGVLKSVPSQKCDCKHLPKRQVLPTYTHKIHEEHGYIWYFYDNENSNDKETKETRKYMPQIPATLLQSFLENSWKPVYGEIVFDSTYWNVFDNAIDITHIHFLHGDTFGNSSKPEINNFEIIFQNSQYVHMKFQIYNKPANLLWHWTIVDNVDVDMQIWLPCTSIIKISLGSGIQMITVVNTTPINSHQSINRFCLWRNFAQWDFLDIFAYKAMIQILEQDKYMVEQLKPEQSLQEISLQSDMPQIAYRKLRQNVMDSNSF